MSPLYVRIGGEWLPTAHAGAIRASGAWMPFGPEGGGPDPVSYTIHGDHVPPNKNNDDDTVYVLGTYFTPTVPGILSHFRWYKPISPQPSGAPVPVTLHRLSNGEQLIIPALQFDDTTGDPNSWNLRPIPGGYRTTPGTDYCVTIGPLRRYTSTPEHFEAASTVGPFEIPQYAGRYSVSNVLVMPTNQYLATSYSADVVFVPD